MTTRRDMLEPKNEECRILFRSTFEVPYHAVQKNNRPIFRNSRSGRAFLGKSKRLTTATDWLVLNLRKASANLHLSKPFQGPLHLLCVFYLDNYWTKAGVQNKKIPDLDNMICFIQDCLQTAEVIVDDGMIECLDGSRRLPGSRNEVLIELREFHGTRPSAGNSLIGD